MTNTDPSGITEGGDWYVIDGGRQDYMNYWHHCKEVTIELSTTKLLDVENLNTYWNYNKNALLNYIKESLYGIRGIVTNQQNQPLYAKIEILNYDKDNSWITTDPDVGNYHRPINPGTYQVKYSADGYISQTHTITINSWNTIVRKDIVLEVAPLYTISGYVIDAKTGSPLSNVSISLENTSLSPVYTDNNGYYSLTNYQETYNIIVSKSGYTTILKSINLNANTNLDFALITSENYSFETGIPSEFTMSGDLPWTRVNTQAYQGHWSLKSGEIGNNASSTVTLTKTTLAGIISFYKKVSSEADYDKLHFYIDNVEQGTGWSGEIDWSKETYSISAGNHTFKWTYTKDGSQIGGTDDCWIDFIELPSQAPAQYTINFHVLYGTDNVTDATVHLLGYNTKNTDNQGIATFSNVYQTTGQITYSVNSPTYGQKTGTVQVSSNTNVEVQLKPLTINEQKQEFEIYPNPIADNYLNIFSSTSGTATISDISGKKLMQIIINQQKQQIDISQLQKGIYIIKFTNDSGSEKYIKLIKQ